MQSKWAKLNFQQAEVTKEAYENILNSYLEENSKSNDFEWYHHMKCWKRFSDKEKTYRQKRKEEKGEETSSTSTEEPSAEKKPLEPLRKLIVILYLRETNMYSQ